MLSSELTLPKVMYKCTFCGMLYKYIPLKGEAWFAQFPCECCGLTSTYKRIIVQEEENV